MKNLRMYLLAISTI